MRGRAAAIARALGALVAVIVLVVGVPALLVSTVGNPFPSELPTIDEIRILLTQQGQGFSEFVAGTLAVVVWIVWAQLVVALVVEIVALVRRSQTPRLPVFPGIQPFVTRLVAPIALFATLSASPGIAPSVAALSFGDLAGPTATTELVIDATSSSGLASESVVASTVGRGTAPAESTTTLIIDDIGVFGDTAPPATTAGDGVAGLLLEAPTELWDLAEAAYGDGLSWKQIALANAGRIDAAGGAITIDTESVPAGTILALPGAADATAAAAFGTWSDGATDGSGAEAEAPGGGVRGTTSRASAARAASETAAGSGDAAEHVVEPGESMWTIAHDRVAAQNGEAPTDAQVGEYWADVVALNGDVRSGDVDLIYPGEQLDLPALDGEIEPGDVFAEPQSQATDADMRDVDMEAPAEVPPEVDAAPETAATPEAEAPEPPADPPADEPTELAPAPPVETVAPEPPLPKEPADTSADSGLSVPAIGMSALGAAILSAGVVGAVRRRRDLQRRTRPAGAIARPPSTAASAFEAAMLHAADELRESQLGLGWRMLPASAFEPLRSTGALEFHADAAGSLSIVPLGASGEPADATPAGPQKRIALGPDTSPGELLAAADTFDVDAGALEGSRSAAERSAGRDSEQASPSSVLLGTDTATGDAVFLDLASVGSLELVGDSHAIRRMARGVVLDLAVSDRADDVLVLAVDVGLELDDLDRVHAVDDLNQALVHAVRSAHTASDSETPVVVVVATQAAPDQGTVGALRDLGVLVVAPALGSDHRVDLTGDHGTLAPGGSTFELAAFDDEQYRFVAELVESTGPSAVEIVDSYRSQPLDIIDLTDCPVEAGPIEVKVLGPVTIDGADSFSSVKAVDIIAYLAFHRHGVDADQLKTWVWPPFEPPTDKAFANVMSRARSGLGTDDDGTPFLSRAGADKTYRLADAVTTDFDRFRSIVELADQQDDPAATVAHLHQALELIRGVPFTGGAVSSFAWADNHVRAQVEYTIDETVHRCADLALDLGDLATARRAVLKGLELVPGCEQCYRRRFLIAGADNNRTELRRAMADLEASAMIELGEPEAVDLISGDLLDLYHELDRALVAGTT